MQKLDPTVRERIKAAQALATRFGSAPKVAGPTTEQQPVSANPALAAAQAAALAAAQQLGQKATTHPSTSEIKPPLDITAAAQAAVQALRTPTPATQPTKEADQQHYATELEINDFPQQARWKITHRDTINAIGEQFSAAVVVRGRYFKPGTQVPEGERKLYLIIEGSSMDIVKKAKAEIKKILEESTEKAMRREAPALM
jgi:ATP-dependent RNA helicase DDX46/PRP5